MYIIRRILTKNNLKEDGQEFNNVLKKKYKFNVTARLM